jgi:hypothetical protein
VHKDALELRAKIDVAILKTIVQRLNAHTVARENEPTRGPYPDGKRKHPAQPRKALGVPLQESVEDDLGIAARLEPKTFGLQLGAQLRAIKNLTVEHNDDVSIRTEQRLVTTLQIEDAEADRS